MKILIVIILIIICFVLIYRTKKYPKNIGGNKYISSHNAKELKPIDNFSSNDKICKYIIEQIIRSNINDKRCFLIDTFGRTLIKSIKFIDSNPHTILNLRNQIDINTIQYFSTIEFNENYKIKHWVKSILSDCVNMGIMINPKLFETEEYITNESIISRVINFINFHFNYSESYFSKFKSETKIKELLNNEITINLYDVNINKDIIGLNLSKELPQIIVKSFSGLFDIIFNKYSHRGWVMINFNNNSISVNYYRIEHCEYSDYYKYSLFVHLYESDENFKPNGEKHYSFSYKDIIEYYRKRILKLQTKSNYMLKIIDIKTMSDENFKFVLKNENITCPNPDCFMVQFE